VVCAVFFVLGLGGHFPFTRSPYLQGPPFIVL